LAVKLLQDRIPSDVELRRESQTVSDVICTRCGEQIGRLEIAPVEASADEEEIYAEIRLIADEHRRLCTSSEAI
jgi:hypothetical protein